MKKQLLTLAAAFVSFASFAQTIPNGNFENWTVTTVENPQFFMCGNQEGDNGNYPSTPPVTKTTDAYHGTYAIRMTSALFNNGTDTSKAWVADGNPGQTVTGGIPYNQTPTGVRFYYKANCAAGDTAINLVIFKKNGLVIGQYFTTIGNQASNYTLFTHTFSPALSQTPDTVVFACASSNLMYHDAYPGSMLQIDSVSFTGVASQPTNFNGDFELWQNDSRYNIVGWNADRPNQTTDKYKGTYALELMTSPPGFGNNQPQMGYASTGYSDQSGTYGGLPFGNQVDTLVFYYKYLPANYPLSTDSAQFNFMCKNNGVFINNLGGSTQRLLGYSGSYKKVEIPINLASVPDSMIIMLQSSKWPLLNSYVGSDFKIDQMYLKSQVIPVSDFIMPTDGCKGVPIQLVDNSANGPTSWQWFMTSATPNNSTLQNPSITYNSTGTFTVSLQAADSFGTGSFISKVITIHNNPVVTASSASVCAGNLATLTAGGASTYTWNTAATGATLTVTPSATTSYTVVGTSTVGCSAQASGTVFVPTPVTPALCMVSVDSLTNNNIIYWDKTSYTNADSFIVYREVSTNVYSRIGAVSKSALSELKDTMRLIGPANGDPSIGSYRYKLQLRDTCGNYSALSLYHNTVKITDQQNGNFQWNTYDVESQATPVANFILERDNANNGVWTVVGIVSGTQTSLFDGQYGTYQTIANWRVQATGFNCTPTAKYGNNTTQGAIVKSKSNITNNRTTSVSHPVAAKAFVVYPNPAHNNIMIQSSTKLGNVVIVNAIGEVVYSARSSDNTQSIDISSFSAGIYVVQAGNQRIKLVKE